tara:strand:- start:202 stop:528 length:327 start_codon:yes stop_codon:yes gene_type:complete
MANFAKLNEENIVTEVVVTDDNDPNGDEGYSWLVETFGGNWLKTSFAVPGSLYDEERDAFIPEKKFPSWVLDEETLDWVPPVQPPQDGKGYIWVESFERWEEYSEDPS